MIEGSLLDLPASGRTAAKVFQLEFMRVAEFIPLLQGMLNATYGAPVPLPIANAVLITDSVSNLQRVEKLVQQLDRPAFGGLARRRQWLRGQHGVGGAQWRHR